MTTVPACKIVTVDPDTVAMDVFVLAYENAPGLFEVGGERVNVPPFEYVCVPILKLVRIVVALLITNVAVVVWAVYNAVSAWVAVIVTVPACKMVTMFPDTLAMFELELAYENAPGLVDDGCGIVNVAPLTKNVCAGIVNVVAGIPVDGVAGVPLLITKSADMLPDV
jgi:hypothetical protein